MLLKSYGLRDERELSVGARLACGALAGTTGQTVAYPFDVARRRLQVSGWQGARELHSDHGSVVSSRGMTDCFVRTVREEGFAALFKVCFYFTSAAAAAADDDDDRVLRAR